MRRLALLAFLVTAAPAHAHTGYIDIKDHAYTPGTLTVAEGSLVEWRWDGPDLDHSVTGDGFDSDPDGSVSHKAGDTFPHLFDTPGTYEYVCRVHADMRGTVIVTAGDKVAPALSRVRARVKRGRVVVRFGVSERASVLAELRRGGKVVRDKFAFVAAGRRTVVLRGRRGRVHLVAQDDLGNRSEATVPVRR